MAGEYSAQDLKLLRVIRNKAALKGTAYFEFHPKNLENEHSSWNEGSIYLADSGFDFFCECFHRSNREFDYFAFCKFNSQEIDKLISEIKAFVAELGENGSGVFGRYSGLFGSDMWDNVSRKDIKKELGKTAEDLIRFFRDAKVGSGVLWVLGM